MEKKTGSALLLPLLLLGMLALAFDIQPVRSDWTWTEIIYIRADGSIDPDTARISTDDNITYTFTDNIVGRPRYVIAFVVERDNIVVDGAGYTLQGWGWGWGIWLSGRSNVTVQNMTTKIHDYGILLEDSQNNTISENYITDNRYGILLVDSQNNTISGNYVTNNFWYGINLHESSNNIISGNNIAYSAYGILLYESSNNKFYHNNFINNTKQVFDWSWMPGSILHPSINVWDDGYPSGGNYWSDHVTVDDYSGINQDEPGSDGIVDEPYIIDDNNRDNYPLVEPWTPIERKVGVKIGDWVRYGSFHVSWSSNDPDATMPIGLSLLSETEWWENSVEDILDTKIKYQQLLHFKNGSEYTTTVWINIDTGSGTKLSFISSGLGPGDCLYDSAPWFAWKINDTISRVYIGVPREVNFLNITTSMHIGPPPAYPNSTGNFYWDKETGVLCELSMKHLNQTGSHVTSWSVFYEIVGTNLWEAPNPAEEAQELIETIETWGLPKGTENSLTSKLGKAIHLLNKGNEKGAIHKLMDFTKQVEALRGKKLANDKADYLISEAQRIIDLIQMVT